MRLSVRQVLTCLAGLLYFMVQSTAGPAVLQVDFGLTNGVIRALHGVNKGPLGPG